jgi:2-C-methyl-D-erythritol 4-phosphate cytidylyltransferase
LFPGLNARRGDAMTTNSPKTATDLKVDQVLIDRLRTLLDVRETRYVVLVTDERQQRVLDAREVSLAEMVAILDANGLLMGPATAAQPG